MDRCLIFGSSCEKVGFDLGPVCEKYREYTSFRLLTSIRFRGRVVITDAQCCTKHIIPEQA